MKELSLHITDRCNFHCRFCVWGETLTLGAERVPADELRDFLRAHAGQGFERVNLHGGEPTLSRELLPLLRLARELGYPAASIQTNGWALANRAFVERLIGAGVTLFVVSVHGHTPAQHDAACGRPGALERLLRGLRHARAAGALVRSNTVVTRLNLDGLPEIAALVVDAGATHVNLSALMPSGRALDEDEALMPRYAEAAPRLRRAAERARRGGARVSLEGFPCCVVPELAECCLYRRPAHGDQVTCLVRGAVWPDHDAFVEEHAKTKQPGCAHCRHAARCPGVYALYVRTRGWSEFRPVPAPAAAKA